MRLQTLLLSAVLLAPGLAGANELIRVYDLAVQNDAQIRAAAFARDSVHEASPIARGPLLPQVNGTGSISEDWFTRRNFKNQDPTKPSDEAGCNAQGGSFSGGNCTTKSQPYSISLSLNQTLFNWEQWSRHSQANIQGAAADVTYHAAQQQLVLRVTEAFFNVLAATDSVRVAGAAQKAVERQLELAKKRFEVGLAAITDQQEAQASYDITAADMIVAEQALASAREALAEIIGTSDVKATLLREEIPLVGPVPDSVGDWLKSAQEGNFSVIGAHLQVDIAEKDTDAYYARHYPTLGLNGTATDSKSTGFNTGVVDDSRVTLQLNVPIFAGGTTQALVRQSRATYEQRKAELDSARRAAERTTKDSYQGVIAGVARVRALKQAVLSNHTALEASEVGLEVGARTNVDVLNAQQKVSGAERDYSRARYDYLLNVLRLKAAAGQLGSKDLTEIDQLLETTDAGH